jgi:hypothetical protein
MSVLLRAHPAVKHWSFLSSDASSAPPTPSASSSNDTAASVHCVARGPWATCLPVEVVGVEVDQPAGGNEDKDVSADQGGTDILLLVSVHVG